MCSTNKISLTRRGSGGGGGEPISVTEIPESETRTERIAHNTQLPSLSRNGSTSSLVTKTRLSVPL
ncbi:hypothetical protein DERP_007851 [Dermatophagoides pteronyssinus]|uniref:Uncharacterized protein n=1 Tax=Dermatophagoides pteronyssinus TaxID=6956 RepID=A0ABQ8ISS2_DERPT|nr:hypothetical protein DERP_007851 [Dermatophagoides pteronyssinus]